MLEQAAGLSPRALEAIAQLERQVVDADDGRLKLEWSTLRRRGGERARDVLWWEDDRLLGFLGLYDFGSPVELAGMVAPDARRRGIGTALLDAGLALCREHGHSRALLIVPRPSAAGKHLALRRGGTLDHSEHALVLSGDPTAPTERPRDPTVSLRPATVTDLEVVSRLLQEGFGEPPPDDLDLDAPHRRTVVVERRGSPVGTLFLTRDMDDGRVYGFVIDPPLQGRGIGREALRLACEQLRADGARRIGLEVAVDNDRALGLYTSVGFTPFATEDYYALPVSSSG